MPRSSGGTERSYAARKAVSAGRLAHRGNPPAAAASWHDLPRDASQSNPPMCSVRLPEGVINEHEHSGEPQGRNSSKKGFCQVAGDGNYQENESQAVKSAQGEVPDDPFRRGD